MKRLLLILLSATLITSAANAQATFTVPSDTVYQTVNGAGTVYDDITNITSSSLTVKWRVVASDFPSDWLSDTALGICDNSSCRVNSSYQLWNPSTSSGTSFTSASYVSGVAGNFDLTLDLMYANAGTHWISILLTDAAGGLGAYSKTITFVINKQPTAVPQITGHSQDVQLYPNPAQDEVNLVYDATCDIKTVAIYNIIGKVMNVYKVGNSSANLNVSNIPSGIYFVRLMNSKGEAVVTRKFTKQ